MAILTKKTIFQRSTTFFAHFVHFYILDFIFFFSVGTDPLPSCRTIASWPNNCCFLREIVDAVPPKRANPILARFDQPRSAPYAQ